MSSEANPFNLFRDMMAQSLDRAHGVTQMYIDLLEKTMRGLPNANEDQINAFKESLERQVATNHEFIGKLLRANDFQEALKIQTEYFQQQLKTATDNVAELGGKVADLPAPEQENLRYSVRSGRREKSTG